MDHTRNQLNQSRAITGNSSLRLLRNDRIMKTAQKHWRCVVTYLWVQLTKFDDRLVSRMARLKKLKLGPAVWNSSKRMRYFPGNTLLGLRCGTGQFGVRYLFLGQKCWVAWCTDELLHLLRRMEIPDENSPEHFSPLWRLRGKEKPLIISHRGTTQTRFASTKWSVGSLRAL